MQVGEIMSGPPWRVGLRTTQEVSPPRCGRLCDVCRTSGTPTPSSVPSPRSAWTRTTFVVG